MAQVKKADVRDAIIESAYKLFSEKDYSRTSMAQIARRAGLSTSTIYVYFSSKLEVLWAVMGPWLHREIELLDLELTQIEDPRARIERLLTALWGDIPAADNNLAINILQGVALSEPSDNYSRELLKYVERRVSQMLESALPPERVRVLGENDAFAHLAFMAFDGFVLGGRVKGRSDRLRSAVKVTTAMLLGEALEDAATEDAAVSVASA